MKRLPHAIAAIYLVVVAVAVIYAFQAASAQPYFGHSFREAGWLTLPWTWLTFEVAGVEAPHTLAGLAVVVAIFAALNALILFSIARGGSHASNFLANDSTTARS